MPPSPPPSSSQPYPLPSLRDHLKQYGIEAKKSLGQHFLLDMPLLNRIASLNGSLEGKHVIEIGPGPGGLTRAILAQNPASLTVVEKDSRCMPLLEDLVAHYPQMVIRQEDATRVDWHGWPEVPSVVISNLPYNVSTVLLVQWLHALGNIESMILMFQKEVAKRIVAPVGGKEYGRLAVMSQHLSECHLAMDVAPGAFSPPPAVMSSVVVLTPKPVASVSDVPSVVMEQVAAAAFGQRRKMLRGSLKALGLDVETLLADANIDGQLRAEQLDLAQFRQLCRSYMRLREKTQQR